MKQQAYIWIAITMVLLLATAVFVAFKAPYSWVFWLVIFGQIVWLFTVFKVLRDAYSTNKTFKDWYEDRPKKTD